MNVGFTYQDHKVILIDEAGDLPEFIDIELLEHIRSLQLKGSYADIGCGHGNFSVYCSLFCVADEVHAVEVTGHKIDIISKNIGLNSIEHKVNIESMDIEQSSTDLVNLIGSINNLSLVKISQHECLGEILKGISSAIRQFTPVLFIEPKDASQYNEVSSFLFSIGYLRTEKNLQSSLYHEFTHYNKGHKKYFDVSGYWENRYLKGGTSGAGSYNRLAQFKAQFLNKFVEKHNIRSVTELGCGDGAQVSLAQYPLYIGLDISKSVIDKCRNVFSNDDSKKFYVYDPNSFNAIEYISDLAISLDVIYHLSNDEIYHSYLKDLFDVSEKYVIIYTNTTKLYCLGVNEHSEYVRFRDVLTDVKKNYGDWGLVKALPNQYPFNPSLPNITSFADFYVFKKFPAKNEIIEIQESFLVHKTFNQLISNAEQTDLLIKETKEQRKALDKITNSINVDTKRLPMLEAETNVLSQKCKQLEQKLVDAAANREHLERKLVDAVADRERLERQLTALEEKYKSLEVAHKLLTEKYKVATSKREGHYQNLTNERQKTKELSRKVKQLEHQLKYAETSLAKIKSSATYQAGYHLKNATSIKGFLHLPLALYRVYRNHKLRRAKELNGQVSHSGKQSKLNVKQENIEQPPSELKIRASIIGWPELFSDNDKPFVLGVMDEFTTGCFNKEINLVQPRPDNWQALAEKYQISLIFVESAWKGNFGSWQYRVANYTNRPGNEVAQLSQYGREKKIPVIFWNKEDPVHHDKFMESAQMANVIFTTDANMVKSYRDKTGNSEVYTLPFAAQPSLHKPSPLSDRIQKSCFAGSWYGGRHAERGEAMQWLLKAANPLGLDIYDRNHGSGVFPFPEEYQDSIKGSLPYEALCKEYGRYRVFLNVNSVTNSPTMFSRRVFELLACGTPVISTYSQGINEMFGSDVVWFVNNEMEARHAIQVLMTDDREWRKRSLVGIRKVFSSHTYMHRLQYIYEKVGVAFAGNVEPSLMLIASVENKAEYDNLLAFAKLQSWENFTLTIEAIEGLLAVNNLPPNIRIVPKGGLKVGDFKKSLDNYDLIGWIDPSATYGPHYLQDLINATRYAQEADAWGKSTGADKFSYNEPVHGYATIQRVSSITAEYFDKQVSETLQGEYVYCLDGEEYAPKSTSSRLSG